MLNGWESGFGGGPGSGQILFFIIVIYVYANRIRLPYNFFLYTSKASYLKILSKLDNVFIYIIKTKNCLFKTLILVY